MSIDTSNQFPDFGHQPPVDPDQGQPAPSESVVHSGNVPTDEGGERPDRELPGTLLDDVHEGRIVPPTTNDSRRNWFARHPKISGLSAVTVLGLVGFGAYELGTQNDDSHATPPLGSETAVSSAPFSSANLSTPPSPIDKGTAKVSIVAPPVPTNETVPSPSEQLPTTANSAPTSEVDTPSVTPENNSELQPVYVEVDGVDKTNASIVLGALLNNVFIAEETGNDDGYRAAFAQSAPDSYGPLQDQVDFAKEHTPAYIAGRAIDPKYPLQSAEVESIQSIGKPDPNTGDVTIGATVKITRVIPPSPEQGTTKPRIQKETVKAAYVLGKVTVTNFQDKVNRTITVIKQEYGYSTFIG